MATGLLIEGANSQADDLIAAFPWIQLHTQVETIPGVPLIAGNATRKDTSAAFSPAFNGVAISDVEISWSGGEVDTSETYRFASFWSASTNGTCGFTSPITGLGVSASGDSYAIAVGALTVNPADVGISSAAFEVFSRATHHIIANSGRPYDTLGKLTVERGDTQDGSYLMPFIAGGIGAACLDGVTTFRPFQITPTLDDPTTDILDFRVIFYSEDYSRGFQVLSSKYNTSGDQRVWDFYITSSNNIVLEWSDDGTAGVSQTFSGLTLVDKTAYAIRYVIDFAGGTSTWDQHAVVDALAGDWSQTPISTENETHSMTLNVDATVPIAIGCQFGADPEVVGATMFQGVLAYFQVRDGDGGTPMATFDPTTDANIGDVGWTDSTTTADTWGYAVAPVAQSDHPTAVIGKALDLPGASGDWAHTPDSAAASQTGDLQIDVHLTMDDWTPPGTQTFMGKWENAGDQQSFIFGVISGSNGFPFFQWDEDGTGTTVRTTINTTGFSFANGTDRHIRVTVQMDGGGFWRSRFYTSTDGITWAQLGADVAAGPGSPGIFDSTAKLGIGSKIGTDHILGGIVHSAQLYDDIGGDVVVDYRPSHDAEISDSTFTSSRTGEVWTQAGSSSIIADPIMAALVGGDLYFDGSDWLVTTMTPTFTATVGKFTAVMVFTNDSVGSGFDRIFSTESSNNDGLQFRLGGAITNSQFAVGGATTAVNTDAAGVPAGVRRLVGCVVDDGTIRLYTSETGTWTGAAVDITGVGTITHAPMQIGNRASDDALTWPGDMKELLIYDGQALTEADLDDLVAAVGV